MATIRLHRLKSGRMVDLSEVTYWSGVQHRGGSPMYLAECQLRLRGSDERIRLGGEDCWELDTALNRAIVEGGSA